MDQEAYLPFARTLCEEAGRIIVDARAEGRLIVTGKAGFEVVTDVDQAVDAHVKQRLARVFGTHRVLSEEDEEHHLVDQMPCWIVGQTFWAVKGGGAFRDGRRIMVSGLTDVRRALIAVGFPHYRPDVDALADRLKLLLREFGDIRRLAAPPWISVGWPMAACPGSLTACAPGTSPLRG